MALVFLFLYAPILLLIVFSFNKGNSNTVWTGFSLDWYRSLFQNRLIMRSVYKIGRASCRERVFRAV